MISPLLENVWRLACLSKDLGPGQVIRRILFDQAIAIGRTKSGAVFALDDVCPHRAAPLSRGQLHDGAQGTALACPYHGWQFDIGSGTCTKIPALSQHDPAQCHGIRVRAYKIHEANGLVWVFHGETENAAHITPPVFSERSWPAPNLITIVDAEGPFDEAVLGLVDPAHTPFVHKQWWWREGRAAQEKKKQFEPTPMGFKMPAHQPSSNSRIYAMLGGAPTTEIEFRLPGLRIETIRNGKACIIGLTAITPMENGHSRIFHLIYWDCPLLTMLKPFAAHMAKSFLAQDGNILSAQAQNLRHAPHRALYLGEPDVPSMWYFQLKKAYAQTIPGTAFQNPLKPQTLRWKT